MNKKGFTLIEVLISASIFSIIFLIGTQSYISAVKQSFFSTSNQIFDNQLQIFINRLDNLIEGQTINLNEYFVQCHKTEHCPFYGSEINSENQINFGKNEGLYFLQFFDLGLQADGTFDGYSYDCTNNDCNLGILDASQDIFEGFFGLGPNTNAICFEDNFNNLLKDKSIANYETFVSQADCNNKNMEFSVLFLKSVDESSQTILGNWNGNLVYKKLSQKNNIFLEDGRPTIFAEFQENQNFNSLLSNQNQDILNFQNLEIQNFKVIISPLEDPNFALAENNLNQIQAPRLEVSFSVSQKNTSKLFKMFNKEIKIHKIYNL